VAKLTLKLLAILSLGLICASSLYFVFFVEKGEPFVLVRAEGRYFVQPSKVESPPPEVQEILGYLNDRSSKISSYQVESTITVGTEAEKSLQLVDRVHSRSRNEVTDFFNGVETRQIKITVNSTSYRIVPETGIAIRMNDTSSGDDWGFSSSSECLGLEEFRGVECFRLKDIFMGSEINYWYTKQTGLIAKSTYMNPSIGQNITSYYRYSDFNTTFDPSLFALPPGIQVKDLPVAEGEGIVRLAIPILTEDQAPIFVGVETNPSEYLLDYRVMRETGINQVVEVRLKSTRDKIAEIRWIAYTMAKPKDYSSLPKSVLIPTTPEVSVVEWMEPQLSVQSTAADIESVAKELLAQDRDLWRTSENVLAYMENVRPRGGVQDALNVLRTKGAVCNGYATLSCALLRANGIPARVLTVMPVGLRLTMHYLTEFDVPGYGWVWLEPSFKNLPHQPTEDVVIGVVYPQDDLGTGALDRGVYSSGDIILTLNNPETSEMGGLNSTRIMSFTASNEEAVDAYMESAKMWESYLTNVNLRSTAEKETILKHIIEGLSAFKARDRASYLTFMEDLVNYYESSSPP
jgi:transglutaminase-like putative cysteine protease